jgi:cell division protein FtsN
VTPHPAEQRSQAATEPPLSVAKSITPPTTKPAEPPPQKSALQPAQKPVPQRVASASPAQLVAKTPAAAPSSTPVTSGAAYFLQIGAYKSQAEADAAWKTFQSKHAGTLSGYAPDVKMVDLGEKGTWYRLRVSSFADKNAAAALCTKLTAEGGACFPAK